MDYGICNIQKKRLFLIFYFGLLRPARVYSDFCVDALLLFVQEVAPTLGIHIFEEDLEITNKRVLIAFALKDVLQLARDSGQTWV